MLELVVDEHWLKYCQARCEAFFFLAVISKYEISSTVAQWLLLLLHSSDVRGDFHRKASIDDDRKKHA